MKQLEKQLGHSFFVLSFREAKRNSPDSVNHASKLISKSINFPLHVATSNALQSLVIVDCIEDCFIDQLSQPRLALTIS